MTLPDVKTTVPPPVTPAPSPTAATSGRRGEERKTPPSALVESQAPLPAVSPAQLLPSSIEAAPLGESAPRPLAIPAFRRFWAGELSVMMGVQFYGVALTWLVLALTGSGAGLGIVLMVNGLPRAALMLVGGVFSDRYPPRVILFVTAAINAFLMVAVAVLLALDGLTILLLLPIAGLFGAVDAFFYPTAQSVVPRLIAPQHLNTANAMTQGGEQITNVFGPALAGFAIAVMGLPAAFAVNSVLFTVGVLLMRGVRIAPAERPDREAAASHGELLRQVLREIRQGTRFAWNTPAIRVSLIIVAALNFAMIGPMIVGGARLAEQRFGGSAAAFGSLVSAYGVGALVGLGIALLLPPLRNPARLLGGVGLLLGAMLVAMGFAYDFTFALIIAGVMGIGGGVAGVQATTWLQTGTPAAMQGRIASLLMFSAVALDPLSQAAAGFLSDISLEVLFLAAGALMLLVGAIVVTRAGKIAPRR